MHFGEHQHLLSFVLLGFVGRLVCEHLTRHYQGKVRWAMAGRNQAKLKDLRANLAKINPAVHDTAILLVRSAALQAAKYEWLQPVIVSMGTQEQISTPASNMTSRAALASTLAGSHQLELTREPAGCPFQ